MELKFLEYLFWLLIVIAVNSQETSLWYYNILGFKELISFEAQQSFEVFSEFSISLLSFYILFFISKQNSLLISFIIFVLGIIYFLDGLSSVLMLIDRKNPNYKLFYDTMFTVEFIGENITSFLVLFLLYTLIFI
jgi:hypothetical protein